jgi:hypothetical protein
MDKQVLSQLHSHEIFEHEHEHQHEDERILAKFVDLPEWGITKSNEGYGRDELPLIRVPHRKTPARRSRAFPIRIESGFVQLRRR